MLILGCIHAWHSLPTFIRLQVILLRILRTCSDESEHSPLRLILFSLFFPGKNSLSEQRNPQRASSLKLDAIENLKATNLKATLEHKRFFVDWFRDQEAAVDLKNPALQLQTLLIGAPKIRALLRNIRSQVSIAPPPPFFFCENLPI